MSKIEIKVKILIDYNSQGLFGHEEPIFINCSSFDNFLEQLVSVWKDNKCKFSLDDTDQFHLSVMIDEKEIDLKTFEYNEQDKEFPHNFYFEEYDFQEQKMIDLVAMDIEKTSSEIRQRTLGGEKIDNAFELMKELIGHLTKTI